MTQVPAVLATTASVPSLQMSAQCQVQTKPQFYCENMKIRSLFKWKTEWMT